MQVRGRALRIAAVAHVADHVAGVDDHALRHPEGVTLEVGVVVVRPALPHEPQLGAAEAIVAHPSQDAVFDGEQRGPALGEDVRTLVAAATGPRVAPGVDEVVGAADGEHEAGDRHLAPGGEDPSHVLARRHRGVAVDNRPPGPAAHRDGGGPLLGHPAEAGRQLQPSSKEAGDLLVVGLEHRGEQLGLLGPVVGAAGQGGLEARRAPTDIGADGTVDPQGPGQRNHGVTPPGREVPLELVEQGEAGIEVLDPPFRRSQLGLQPR